MFKFISPVGYANHAIELCEEAIARIIEMENEGIQTQKGLDSLAKDKERFIAAKEKLLEILRSE